MRGRQPRRQWGEEELQRLEDAADQWIEDWTGLVPQGVKEAAAAPTIAGLGSFEVTAFTMEDGR